MEGKSIQVRPWRSAAVFGIALLARIIYFFAMQPYYEEWKPEAIPRNGWIEIASHVADGRGFRNDSLLTYFPVNTSVPTAARSPVPILVFAGLILLTGGDWYYPLLILSWCLSGLTAALLYWTGTKVTRSERIGLVAALVFSLYLSEMYIVTTFSTCAEPLFTALLAIYLVFAIRCTQDGRLTSAALGGVVLGLACLTRPSVLFLPVVFLIWLVISRPRHSFIAACLFLVAFVSVQLPWVVRNSRVFGQPVITTTLGGFILYRHNAMIAEDEYFWAYDYDQFKPMVRSVVRRSGYELEELNEAQINALLLEEAKTVIREYRWRYFKLALMRCARVWYLQNSGRGLYAVQNLLVYLGMCVGCLYAVRTRNLMIVAVLLHVGYFVAIHAAINAQYRFICPMMPYVIMVSVWGVAQLCSQERRFGKWIQPASAT